MSDTATELAAADALDVDAFITRGNAIAAGQEPLPLPEPVAASAEAVVTASEVDGALDDDKPERDETTGQFKPVKKASPQKRIDAAVAKQREAERETADLKARIAALEAKPAAPVAIAPAPVQAPVTASDKKRYQAMPDAPQLAQYDGSDGKAYEDYIADMALFIADKRYEERSAQQAESQRMSSWDAKMKAVEAEIPDLRARIAVASNKSLPNYIVDYLMKRDSGPKLLLHLAEHPADHQRITTLPLDDAIEELVKLRTSFESPAKPAAASSGPAPAPVLSAANPPIKPVGSSPHVTDDADEDEDSWSVDKHIKVYNAKDPAITPRAARR